MKEHIDQIKALCDEFAVDANKHLGGNKAAGLRARKKALLLSALLKEFRKLSMKA